MKVDTSCAFGAEAGAAPAILPPAAPPDHPSFAQAMVEVNWKFEAYDRAATLWERLRDRFDLKKWFGRLGIAGLVSAAAWVSAPAVVWTDGFKNLVTTAGLNNFLGVTLAGTPAATTTWYMGLVDNAGFTAFAAADTSASHAGWTESVAYSESVRQTVAFGTVASAAVSSSASNTFTINVNSTVIKGGFLISVSTKGGSTGTLFCEGAFGATQTLNSGQPLKVTLTVAMTSS